jgi:hypothetical protein
VLRDRAQVVELEFSIRDAKPVQGKHFRKPRLGDLVAALHQTAGDPVGCAPVAILAGCHHRSDFSVGNGSHPFCRPERIRAIHHEKCRVGNFRFPLERIERPCIEKSGAFQMGVVGSLPARDGDA